MKHTQRFGLAAAAALALLIGASCEQGAIFHDISNETKKATADVKGTPTKIVEFNGRIYVANGYLYERGDPGDWLKISTPSGDRVRDIEKAGANFYALTVTDDDQVSDSSTETRVYRTADPTNAGGWTLLPLDAGVAEYAHVNRLASADNVLYAGARADDSSYAYDVKFAILTDDGTKLVGVKTGLDYLGEFAGASYDGTRTYLATAGAGIFSDADSFSAALPGTADSDYSLKGIFSTSGGSTIALGFYNDYTLIQRTPGDGFTADSSGLMLTGAAVEYRTAKTDANGTLLLVGIKSGTTYGYREISLSSGKLTSVAPSMNKPNSDDSSVADYSQYAGSLGVVSVRHLYQAWGPSDESILYASSYNEGLWSSTARGDWNLDH